MVLSLVVDLHVEADLALGAGVGSDAEETAFGVAGQALHAAVGLVEVIAGVALVALAGVGAFSAVGEAGQAVAGVLAGVGDLQVVVLVAVHAVIGVDAVEAVGRAGQADAAEVGERGVGLQPVAQSALQAEGSVDAGGTCSIA